MAVLLKKVGLSVLKNYVYSRPACLLKRILNYLSDMCKSDRYKIGIKVLLRWYVVMPLSGLEFEEFYCVELRISNTVIRYKLR